MRTTLAVLVAGWLAVGCGGRREDAGRDHTIPIEAGSPVAEPEAPPVAPAPEDTGMPSDDAVRAIADTACPTVKAAYFYKIEKKGKTSYILGTRHLGVDIAKLPAEVGERLTAARLAVFETAPDDTSDKAVARPAHGTIADELGAELWTHYQDLLGRELANALADADPSTALLMMMALYEDKSSALDDQLQQLAESNRIPIQGLETSAFQDRLILRWLGARALRAGVKVTDTRAEIKQSTVDDLTEYCAGTDDDPGPDPRDRQDMLDGGYTDDEIAQYEDDLVYSRNRDWIPKLEKIMAKGNVFIAVGADHLIGDRGVVALLGKRGYRVTRVTPP